MLFRVDHPLGPFVGESAGDVFHLPDAQILSVRLMWMGLVPSGKPEKPLVFEVWMDTSMDGVNWVSSEVVSVSSESATPAGSITLEVGLDPLLSRGRWGYRLALEDGQLSVDGAFCFGLDMFLKDLRP